MFYYIYKMIHKPTGRVYIGRHRLQKGQTPETDGYHGSGKVWKQIYKANPEECVKVVLEVVQSKDEADTLEKKFITHYRSVMGEFCVNAQGGGGGMDKHTEESCRKMSESHKGKHLSEESRRKLSEAHKGKQFSEEHRRKLSEAAKGRQFSEETRRKLSEANKGKKSPMFGKQHSEESKRKMSEAHKGEKNHNFGKKFSEATRKKMSETQRRRRLSKEQNDRTVL